MGGRCTTQYFLVQVGWQLSKDAVSRHAQILSKTGKFLCRIDCVVPIQETLGCVLTRFAQAKGGFIEVVAV